MLALIATAGKGGGERLEAELGDILYELDPKVATVRVGSAPDTVLVYSRVDPLRLFRRLYHWPPAYAKRIVPAFTHLPFNPESLHAGIRELLEYVQVGELRLRVEVRGYRAFEHTVKEVVSAVAEELGFRLTRRAGWELIVEGLYPEALIAAVLPVGCDRVDLWWERRGNTRPCTPIIH